MDSGNILDQCWEWHGYRVNGYGRKTLRGKPHATHRLAFEWAVGPIPDGMMVCHRCDNPPCCNPAHLFLGTGRDNARDMCAKGRNRYQIQTHCKKGHPYSGSNLKFEHGARRCRTCRRDAWRIAQRRRLEKLKAQL